MHVLLFPWLPTAVCASAPAWGPWRSPLGQKNRCANRCNMALTRSTTLQIAGVCCTVRLGCTFTHMVCAARRLHVVRLLHAARSLHVARGACVACCMAHILEVQVCMCGMLHVARVACGMWHAARCTLVASCSLHTCSNVTCTACCMYFACCAYGSCFMYAARCVTRCRTRPSLHNMNGSQHRQSTIM